MRRREILGLVGGAAVVWPLKVQAQQTERVRKIGVLMPLMASDPFAQAQVGTFLKALHQSGWVDGKNARIEVRWAGPMPNDIRRTATELLALGPDVVLAYGSSTVGPLMRNTRTVPIVFPVMGDPVAAGFVESLARPGGNATGFMMFEYGMAAKWLELMKEMIPSVRRVAVFRNATTPTGPAQFGVIQAVAPYLNVEVMPLNVHDTSEFEPAIARFALGSPQSGLIVASSSLAIAHRAHLLELAARHKLPAIYGQQAFVADGGLMSYTPDLMEQYRLAAGYVDRILKGERPADLPVQMPAKYILSINSKTAKVLGLTVPPSLLARADEVIE